MRMPTLVVIIHDDGMCKLILIPSLGLLSPASPFFLYSLPLVGLLLKQVWAVLMAM